jgi:hypothetical protein
LVRKHPIQSSLRLGHYGSLLNQFNPPLPGNAGKEGEMRLDPKQTEKYIEYVTRGYSYAPAKDIWAAKIAVEKGLGEFRIGNRVMYVPDADRKTNVERHLAIGQIRSV